MAVPFRCPITYKWLSFSFHNPAATVFTGRIATRRDCCLPYCQTAISLCLRVPYYNSCWGMYYGRTYLLVSLTNPTYCWCGQVEVGRWGWQFSYKVPGFNLAALMHWSFDTSGESYCTIHPLARGFIFAWSRWGREWERRLWFRFEHG